MNATVGGHSAQRQCQPAPGRLLADRARSRAISVTHVDTGTYSNSAAKQAWMLGRVPLVIARSELLAEAGTAVPHDGCGKLLMVTLRARRTSISTLAGVATRG